MIKNIKLLGELSNWLKGHFKKLPAKPAVVNVYSRNFSGGIGDFLAGSVYLFRQCQWRNIPVYLDFKHHPVGQFLNNQQESNFNYSLKDVLSVKKISDIHPQRMEKNLTALLDECHRPVFLSSFYSKELHGSGFAPQRMKVWQEEVQLTGVEKEFFQSVLVFKEEIEKKYTDFLAKHQLADRDYHLVHFRFGDREMLKNQNVSRQALHCLEEFEFSYEDCFAKVLAVQQTEYLPVVILADSNQFKKLISEKRWPKITVSPSCAAHSVAKPGLLIFTDFDCTAEYDTSADLAFDLRLIKGAKKVTSFSNYIWGSGFPFWISKIFDKPFERKELGALISKGQLPRKSLLKLGYIKQVIKKLFSSFQ